MTDLNKQIALELTGNIVEQSRRFGRQVRGFSNSARNSLGKLQPAFRSLSRGLDTIGNRYTGIITGFASGATLRSLTKLEERFTRLGIQAKISEEAVTALREEIFNVALAADVRVDPAQLTAAIEKIVEKTGDLDFARSNLENLGRAIQATGALGQDIGALTSELKKFGLTTQEDVLKALDTLTIQGKEGAFTLQNFATQGERVVSAYASIGRTGPEAVREVGALAQVARQATGSSEMAATAVEAMLRALTDLQKVKALEGAGIQVFDAEALSQGVKQMRSVPSILKDIIAALNADAGKLNEFFGDEGVRAVNAAIIDFQADGEFEQTFDKFIKLAGDGAEINRDSARAANNAAAAFTNLATAATKFADNNLTSHLQTLADTLNSLEPEKLEMIMNALAIGGTAVAGAVIANKAVKGIGALQQGFRSLRKKPSAGPVNPLANAQRVFVVNFPPGLGGGGANDNLRKRRRPGAGAANDNSGAKRPTGRGGRRRGGGRARFGRFGRNLAKGTAASALAFGAYDIGTALADGGNAEDIGGAIGSVGGSVAGIAAGSAAGAAIGSAVPVVGTIAGAIIGGVLAYLGANVGEEIGRNVGRSIAGGAEDGGGEQQPFVIRVETENGLRANINPGPIPMHRLQGDTGVLGIQ